MVGGGGFFFFSTPCIMMCINIQKEIFHHVQSLHTTLDLYVFFTCAELAILSFKEDFRLLCSAARTGSLSNLRELRLTGRPCCAILGISSSSSLAPSSRLRFAVLEQGHFFVWGSSSSSSSSFSGLLCTDHIAGLVIFGFKPLPLLARCFIFPRKACYLAEVQCVFEH